MSETAVMLAALLYALVGIGRVRVVSVPALAMLCHLTAAAMEELLFELDAARVIELLDGEDYTLRQGAVHSVHCPTIAGPDQRFFVLTHISSNGYGFNRGEAIYLPAAARRFESLVAGRCLAREPSRPVPRRHASSALTPTAGVGRRLSWNAIQALVCLEVGGLGKTPTDFDLSRLAATCRLDEFEINRGFRELLQQGVIGELVGRRSRKRARPSGYVLKKPVHAVLYGGDCPLGPNPFQDVLKAERGQSYDWRELLDCLKAAGAIPGQQVETIVAHQWGPLPAERRPSRYESRGFDCPIVVAEATLVQATTEQSSVVTEIHEATLDEQMPEDPERWLASIIATDDGADVEAKVRAAVAGMPNGRQKALLGVVRVFLETERDDRRAAIKTCRDRANALESGAA